MSEQNGNRRKGWVPPFLKKNGVKENEAITLSKQQLWKWQEPGNILPTQVWATLVLHVNGYGREDQMAVTICEAGLLKGEIVPMTMLDVRLEIFRAAMRYYKREKVPLTKAQKKKLMPSKEHARRAFESLEDAGVADRRTDTGISVQDMTPEERQRLHNGRLQMYVWAIPKRRKTVVNPEQQVSTKFTEVATKWLPEKPSKMSDIASEIKHLGLKIQPEQLSLFEEMPAEVQDAYVAYREAAEKLKAALETVFKKVPAPASTTGKPNSANSANSAKLATSPNPPRKPSAPGSHPDQLAEFRKSSRTKDVERDSRAELVEIADAIILPALRKYCLADSDLAMQIFDACRQQDRQCAAEEIAAVIETKGSLKPDKATNGWWLPTITNVFAKGNYAAIRAARKEQERQEQQHADRADRQRDERIRWARATLADPQAREDEKRDARQTLEIYDAMEAIAV